jgi:flagellar protein FliO/FliZ
MKRFAVMILLPVFLILSGYVGVKTLHRGMVFAQEKKKGSGKREASPRRVVDFTAKEKGKDRETTPHEAAKPDDAQSATEQTAAPVDQPKKEGDQLFGTYEAPKEEETSIGWMSFKAILVFGLFGAGFYFFYKYITKRGLVPGIGRNVVQTIAISSVGPNKTIQVIDIAGKLYIVGVTDNGINLLSEVTSKDEIDRIRLLSSKSTLVETRRFQDFVSEQIGSLVSFIGKTKKGIERKKEMNTQRRVSGADEIIDDERVDYLREQRERLKRLNGYRHDEER